MADSNPEIGEDEPLDPTMERLRRKMIRLLIVSIGTMVIGVFAVLFAVVWRINQIDGSALATHDLSVPAGFEISSVSGSETRITLFGVDEDGTERVLIFDTETGEAVINGRINRSSVPE